MLRFSTVALIGTDGSGKTSIARALLETCPLPIKYLYMGTSIESSNMVLPTSRLIHKWKVYRYKKSLEQAGKSIPKKVTLHGLEHRIVQRGKLGATARLLHRLLEESYRQLVSWIYQLRGNIVLYDRHFLYDVCPSPNDSGKHRFSDRVNYWFLQKVYPRPGLAILLNAPAEVLYARKQEIPIKYLEQEQLMLAEKSCYAKKFVRVDTTKPFNEVLNIVKELVLEHCTTI